MTNEEQVQLEEVFKTHLETQFNRGIRVGIKSASSIILDKLKDTSKPILVRVNDVKRFCEVAVNNNDFIKQEKSQPAEPITSDKDSRAEPEAISENESGNKDNENGA